TGVMSDANGRYTLSIPEGTYTVTASFVGYKKVQIPNVVITANQTLELNIKMTGSTELKEVVVSYGRQRQREITGSLAVVSGVDLQDKPDNQFAQELQGKV